MAPLTYDTTCLTVWPEWGSTGIWHPEKRGVDGPVQMVGFEQIALPMAIAQRFEAWIDKFDDYAPGSPEEFDWKTFDTEGQALAQDLANAVRGRFVVEYKLQEVEPCCS